MNKQIKKRLGALLLLCCIVFYTVYGTVSMFSPSDVVENSSTTEEQVIKEEVIIVERETQPGWTKEQTLGRIMPNENSLVMRIFYFNTPIRYEYLSNGWVRVEHNNDYYYIKKEDIANNEFDYNEFSIPNHRDFKSYMAYTAITMKSSPQYKLQNEYAYTGEYGIRKVNERYCIAIGSHFGANIGQYVDLILENGTIIPCIKGDAKANQDTEDSNIFTRNGCCSEFIIDNSQLHQSARNSGNISNVCDEWKSQVVAIRVYEENVFDEE